MYKSQHSSNNGNVLLTSLHYKKILATEKLVKYFRAIRTLHSLIYRDGKQLLIIVFLILVLRVPQFWLWFFFFFFQWWRVVRLGEQPYVWWVYMWVVLFFANDINYTNILEIVGVGWNPVTKLFIVCNGDFRHKRTRICFCRLWLQSNGCLVPAIRQHTYCNNPSQGIMSI